MLRPNLVREGQKAWVRAVVFVNALTNIAHDDNLTGFEVPRVNSLSNHVHHKFIHKSKENQLHVLGLVNNNHIVIGDTSVVPIFVDFLRTHTVGDNFLQIAVRKHPTWIIPFSKPMEGKDIEIVQIAHFFFDIIGQVIVIG